MGIQWHLDLAGLDALIPKVEAVMPEALGQAMEHVRTVAVSRTPVETGRLAGSATVRVEHDRASIEYAGPYARYQHERLDLRHETGQAKYLESALHDETDAAMGIIADRIRRSL